MNLNGKKIAILGAGRSGLGAAHLALSKGAAEVCIFDANPKAFAVTRKSPSWPAPRNSTRTTTRRTSWSSPRYRGGHPVDPLLCVRRRARHR